MANVRVQHYITLGKDAESGTLCILCFSEHELLLKYEIITKETEKALLLEEEVDSSLAKPQQLEQQEIVKEIREPQPTRQPQNSSLPLDESSKDEKLVSLPTTSEKNSYQRLIDLILQSPDMRQSPQVRYRLLPKNLRVRHSRFEQDPVKDLKNIFDWAERYDALPKVFSNLWIEFDKNIVKDDEDERNRLRKELDEIRNELAVPKRKIGMKQSQIPIEYRRFLRNAINARFNLDSLRTICYDLGIDFESLRGPAKPGIVISLLEEVEYQDRVSELITICKSERPYVDWDFWKIGIDN